MPVAHSHGFSPHPRLSWVGAAPTGTASEAEYLEIGLTRPVDPPRWSPRWTRRCPTGWTCWTRRWPAGAALAERIDASRWRIELPGVEPDELRAALAALLAETSVVVERVTPSGRRTIDVRAALVGAEVHRPADPAVGRASHRDGRRAGGKSVR